MASPRLFDSAVLSQAKGWVDEPGAQPPPLLRKRSPSEFLFCVELLLAPSPCLQSLRRMALARTWKPLTRKHAIRRRAKPADKQEAEAHVPDVANVSRVSGRQVKTPTKFNEQLQHAVRQRPRLQASSRAAATTRAHPSPVGPKHISSKHQLGSRRPSLASPRTKSSRSIQNGSQEHEHIESRVGASYQAAIRKHAALSPSAERGDLLLWSSTANTLSTSALNHFVHEATPLCGGSLRRSPTSVRTEPISRLECCTITPTPVTHRNSPATAFRRSACGRYPQKKRPITHFTRQGMMWSLHANGLKKRGRALSKANCLRKVYNFANLQTKALTQLRCLFNRVR